MDKLGQIMSINLRYYFNPVLSYQSRHKLPSGCIGNTLYIVHCILYVHMCMLSHIQYRTGDRRSLESCMILIDV